MRAALLFPCPASIPPAWRFAVQDLRRPGSIDVKNRPASGEDSPVEAKEQKNEEKDRHCALQRQPEYAANKRPGSDSQGMPSASPLSLLDDDGACEGAEQRSCESPDRWQRDKKCPGKNL